MAIADWTEPAVRIVDKEALRRILDEQDAALGFVPVADASIERLRAMMLADGVEPGENIASREILAMREE
ncbi:MAG TPA: hypothetical protein VGM37_05590 [Armatimonadota bacterium]|jgi:hypothetical protein